MRSIFCGALLLLLLPASALALSTRQATERIFRLEPDYLGADYELGWATDLALQHETYAPEEDIHSYSEQARRLTYTVFASIARCKRTPVRGTAQLRLTCPHIGTVQIDGAGAIVTFQPSGFSASSSRIAPKKGGSMRDAMAMMRKAQRATFSRAIGKEGETLWHEGTFASSRASLRYHFKKHVRRHGYRMNPKQYSMSANDLYSGVSSRRAIFRNCLTEPWPVYQRLWPSGVWVTKTGMRIQCPKTLINHPESPLNGWGGIFRHDGQIVTFWLTKGRYP